MDWCSHPAESILICLLNSKSEDGREVHYHYLPHINSDTAQRARAQRSRETGFYFQEVKTRHRMDPGQDEGKNGNVLARSLGTGFLFLFSGPVRRTRPQRAVDANI